jgi:serine/threonine-protein kinase
MTTNSDVVKRFQREVVAAAQLEHKNIVGALDADEIDGTHLFVMQFVDGRDLSVVCQEERPASRRASD